MAEVFVRRESSTAIPLSAIEAGVACPPASRPMRERGRAVDWKKAALLDVLIDNRPMLVDLACSFVGCASLAEDVVHDVFIKLVDFRDQEAVRQPVAYVTRMVHNASVDASRRQSQEGTYHADQDHGLHVPSPEPSPEAALLMRDTLRHVYNALEQLPPRSRAAFEMVRLREETLQNTARALDVSPTRVHVMVRDAERHCADSLDACNRGVDGAGFCSGRGARRR
ncbi:RNA polymerase factor sigma-70 [Paraburkholderia sp. BCC1876]|uniref:RNA polymerase factor sigma-70 n=1 Tax=Paraburkholderia sp. BCC1876 TaxID=2676303 RepID=UPI001590D8B1|nr:RNA polymerase factor sigma-70 [Paraburkholderia sp. BCC1876]